MNKYSSLRGFVLGLALVVLCGIGYGGSRFIGASPARVGAKFEGPTTLYGIAGDYQADVTSSHALKTDASATTQPVSGTFWQTTQPVSGTFWQTTQPVSIAGTVTTTSSVPTANYFATTAIATGGTAVQISSGSQALTVGVTIKNDIASVDPVNIGTSGVNDTIGSGANGWTLYPGESKSFAISNMNYFYFNGAHTTDFVHMNGW